MTGYEGMEEDAAQYAAELAEHKKRDPYYEVGLACLCLRQERGADYGREGITVRDYFPFGDASYCQMVWLKIMRLRSLVASGEEEREKIKDSVLDAINYLMFWGQDLIDKEATR